jgi:integrase
MAAVATTTRRRLRSNGEGTIRYDKGRKRWEGRITTGWTDDGHQIRRKVVGKTRDDVAKRLREVLDAVEHGQDPARRDLMVGRFLDQWLADVLPGTVAPATEQQYRDVVRLYLKPMVGRKRLRTLTARDVARMLRQLEADGRSANTRRLARSVLRRALRWAEAEGMVARNVAAIADGVKLHTTEGRALSPDEARLVLAQLHGHRLAAAFTVALALGLRRGELLGLAWDDLDIDHSPARLTVRRSLKRLNDRGLVIEDTKTQRSRRTVHLPAPAVEALRQHRRRQAEERLAVGSAWEQRPLGADLVFRTPLGTAIDPANFKNACYRLTDAAGVGRRSPHELRHSAASLLIAQGVRLELISELLGHSSIRITKDVYGHLVDDLKAEAAAAMERALWP